MAAKLKGVGGVLGGLISPEPSPPANLVPIAETENTAPLPPPDEQEQSALSPPPAKPAARPAKRIAARRGSPPGGPTPQSAARSKVSVNLDTELMDTYREWSWDERCQLNELIERALRQYLKGRRPKGQ